MCGIAGVLERSGEPADPALGLRMARAMAHRGPDGEGVFADASLVLAHRRLAVLDLSEASSQPMTDGPTTLVYNGEIYNYRALRDELAAKGVRFRSTGDTEVVLQAYRAWGPACVERFDGMFAFAVWDAAERRLFLARDRFGIKPLYYAQVGQRFAFASEIKPLLAAGIPREADPAAMVEYFTFQNALSDRTLMRDVRILEPGCRMSVTVDDRPAFERWWTPSFEPDDAREPETWAGDVRDALRAAVERELHADVPVGAYLSGGMDSGSIVAMACEARPGLPTFTGGFDMSSVSGLEVVYDERAEAAELATSVGSDPHVTVMHAGDMAGVLPQLVWHVEDLRAGTSWQNWHVAALAAGSVTAVLAGTGGDEVFAGYPWRSGAVAEARDADDVASRSFALWSRLVPAGDHAEFFEPALLRAAGDHGPEEVFRAAFGALDGLDPVRRELAFEMRTFLHGLLVVQDRIAMAHSLEERVPFLDGDLVDLASRIPTRLLFDGERGKVVLREAMRGILPDAVVGRAKQGFSPPEGSWYRGPSMATVTETLVNDRSLDRGYFQPAFVRRTIEEHVGGHRDHRLLIWSLLCFEWWNRLFIDQEPLS